MLTSDQIEALGNQAQQLISPVTEYLIEDIARRIAQAGELTGTAAYQAWRAKNLGVSMEDLKKKLQKMLNMSAEHVEKLMEQAAEFGYNFDTKNRDAIPFMENVPVQDIVSAAVSMAQSDLTNITQTIGFVCPDGISRELTEAYQKTCDFAFMKVSTGVQDYNSAIRDAVKNLAKRGIVTIDYESGISTNLDAAVRRNVMSSLGLMQERISQQNHDDFGCDGWEISAHAASAPDHEPIQGRQYSDEEYTRLNNSLVRRIGTLNCGHSAFPIIMGVDSPQYTEKELEQFRKENEDGFDYEGKHYTRYEATQHQRKLERAIKAQKRQILIDEATGSDDLQKHQIKYQLLEQEYKRFSKAAGLRTQHERMEVLNFGPKQAREARKTFKNNPID